MKIFGKGIETLNNFSLRDTLDIIELSKDSFRSLPFVGKGCDSRVSMYKGVNGKEYVVKAINDFLEVRDYEILPDLQGSKYFPKIFMIGKQQKSSRHPTKPDSSDSWYHGNNTINYMVVEKISGKTIQQLINDPSGLTVADVKNLIAQYREAVAFAFERGWIIGDLQNPENMMVKENGDLVIIDVGYFKNRKKTKVRRYSWSRGMHIIQDIRKELREDYAYSTRRGTETLKTLMNSVLSMQSKTAVA